MCTVSGENGERLMIRFTADIIEENINFNTEEILDVKWIDINEVKNMTKEELRGYKTSIQFIKDYEENKIYPLEIFNNSNYNV